MKREIIERLFAEGSISQEEMAVLSSQESLEPLKNFGVWKVWKYDESILLDETRIEEAKVF
jgi:hypothetical protein